MKNDIFQTQLQQGRLQDAGTFPKVILIDTVSFCNLRCSMCCHKDMKRKSGIMPWPLFTRIVDEIAEVNKDARVWMVFFGDPFIIKSKKPTIFDLIIYAKGKGLNDVVLNTNGNLMDEEASRQLISSGLEAIYIGIDAVTPETYSKLRVGGDYERVVKNTISLITLKKVLNSEKPKVYVQFVEMDVNRDEEKAFIKLWKKEGAIVKIRPKISWAGIIEAANQVLDNRNRWPCHWAMQTFSITDTGNVVLCPCDLDAKFIAGNINRQTIKDVWNGKLKELRLRHQNKQFELLPAICKTCKDWQSARAEYYA